MAVLIQGDEDLELEHKIDGCLEKVLQSSRAELVSTKPENLIGKNYGRCIECGAWASDFSKKDRIVSFSNGAQINGAWYCDLCLPLNHPNHF